MTLVLPGFPVSGPPWRAPRVLTIVGAETGCTVWRVFQPIAELQRQGAPVGAVEWGWLQEPRTVNLLTGFDAVSLARISWPDYGGYGARVFADAVRAAGMRLWYEADDDLFSPWFGKLILERRSAHPTPPAPEVERHRRAALQALRLCDGATVSTQRLATIVRQFTDAPVEVVPNAIDWRWFRAVLAAGGPRAVPPLTVGWAGGGRPDADLVEMAWAWGQLARRRPDVTFVVQGHHAPLLYDAVPAERIRPIAWLPLRAYPLGLANIDIGCCPLADGPFARAKTPIKAMEYAAAGAAVVAAPTVYRQLIRHGHDGYLCETREDWLACLERLVDDAAERRRLARNLRRKVATEHSLEANAWRWPAAWARLAARAGEGRRAA